MIFRIKLFLLILRIVGLHLDCWDEWVVNGFSDFAEVIQYKMVRSSGASSSNPVPRWDIDLNLPPREEVEVPVEEATEPDINLLLRKSTKQCYCIVCPNDGVVDFIRISASKK